MPPRLVVVTIIIFWLSAIGWLIQREMWPVWFLPPDEPPAFAIDLMDEIGKNTTSWDVYLVSNGEKKKIGQGQTTVDDKGKGILEFESQLRFPKTPIFDMIVYIGSIHRITHKGNLQSVALKLKLKLPDRLGAHAYEIDFDATIEDDLLKPELRIVGAPAGYSLPKFDPIPVPKNGIVLNPTHLGTRLPPLREGQEWKVPLLDPAAIMSNCLTKTLGVPEAILPLMSDGLGKELWAHARKESLEWNDEEVDCFRVDYAPRGKPTTQTSWIRRRDGQVLQQNAIFWGLELKLVRVPVTGF